MFPIPQSLQRLADQIDGWLDLRVPERALALLEPLLADATARPAALAMRVRALARLGRFADALPDLAELRVAAPGEDWVDETEAWCRRRTGDLRGAIDCLQRLTARNHRSDLGHFNLGCYLALTGETDRAIDEVTLACGLNGEYRDIARDDPDLDVLRTDPRFRELLRSASPNGDAAADDDGVDEDVEDGGEDDDGGDEGGNRIN